MYLRTTGKTAFLPTILPELLRALELRGCIVTIDAMGCQKAIATEICNADTTKKRGIKGKQKNAGWDHSYLLSLLKF